MLRIRQASHASVLWIRASKRACPVLQAALSGSDHDLSSFRQPHASFSSQGALDESSDKKKTLSNNQQFKNITIQPDILAHIREIGVGMHPRTRKNRKLDKISGEVTRQNEIGKGRTEGGRYVGRDQAQKEALKQLEPPRPFGQSSFPVQIVGQLTEAKQELPLFLDNLHNKIPQVAICGRSNVGKSTLLNVLLYSNLAKEHVKAQKEAAEKTSRARRRGKKEFKLPKGVKASTSKTPGETKTITFYQLGAPHPASKGKDLRLLLVDLPGYGFAFANPKDRDNYKDMMMYYLSGSLPGQKDVHGFLSRILLLIDARHGMKKADVEFLNLIQGALMSNADEAAVDNPRQFGKAHWKLPPIQLVLTKCDLVQQVDLARRVVQVRQSLSDALIREPPPLPVLYCSAKTNNGVLEIQKEIADLAATIDPKPPPTWQATRPIPLMPEPKQPEKKKKKKKKAKSSSAPSQGFDVIRRPARNLRKAGLVGNRSRSR